jgi:translation initiation factor 2B subunit (eIF-2B alpha/beta/delta family)
MGGLPRIDFVDTACWQATGRKRNDTDGSIPGHVELSTRVEINNPACDFTPAKFITLLFTDLGVLTTSAVSDELIRLYQ